MKKTRSNTRDYDNMNAAITKAANRIRKTAERDRRDARIIARIKKQGDMPYTPEVMSWLSQKLDKQSAKITTEDVKTVIS